LDTKQLCPASQTLRWPASRPSTVLQYDQGSQFDAWTNHRKISSHVQFPASSAINEAPLLEAAEPGLSDLRTSMQGDDSGLYWQS